MKRYRLSAHSLTTEKGEADKQLAAREDRLCAHCLTVEVKIDILLNHEKCKKNTQEILTPSL